MRVPADFVNELISFVEVYFNHATTFDIVGDGSPVPLLLIIAKIICI